MFDKQFFIAACLGCILAMSACSVYFSPHGKKGDAVITIPPPKPEVGPMPEEPSKVDKPTTHK